MHGLQATLAPSTAAITRVAMGRVYDQVQEGVITRQDLFEIHSRLRRGIISSISLQSLGGCSIPFPSRSFHSIHFHSIPFGNIPFHCSISFHFFRARPTSPPAALRTLELGGRARKPASPRPAPSGFQKNTAEPWRSRQASRQGWQYHLPHNHRRWTASARRSPTIAPMASPPQPRSAR